MNTTKKYWWHWYIEYCPHCKCNHGQMPVRDDLGEDCNLFEKVDAFNALLERKHSCGTTLEGRYRHALADCNCITLGDMPVRKAPLLPDQEEGRGTFMDEAEYERRSQPNLVAS